MTTTPSTELGTKPKTSEQNRVSMTGVRSASLSEWDIIWSECEYSTYFHSREWSEIWSCYTKKKMSVTPFLVLFSDGKKALLPFSCLTEERVMPILMGERRLYVSSPECTYGGWLSTDKLDSNHAVLLLNLIKNKFKNLFWRMNPYDDIALGSGVGISDYGETQAINLKKGFDEVVSNISKSHKKNIKKAIQNGISVRVASSIDDWRDYYRVYEDSVSRWGNRLLADKYSWELFHEIFKRNSPNAELWLAIYQGKVISGSLSFNTRNFYICWNAATIGTYMELGSSSLVKFEQLKRACEKGYAWFDFNPSGGLEGVKAFKERFGAQALECPIVRFKPRNVFTFAMEKVNEKVAYIKGCT